MTGIRRMLVMTLGSSLHHALALLIPMDNVFGRGCVSCQTFVQAQKRRHHFRILLTQSLHQLNRQGRWQWCFDGS